MLILHNYMKIKDNFLININNVVNVLNILCIYIFYYIK